MKIIIRIDTGNAAFEDNTGEECARILRRLSGEMEDHGDFTPAQFSGWILRDINGNTCGSIRTEE